MARAAATAATALVLLLACGPAHALRGLRQAPASGQASVGGADFNVNIRNNFAEGERNDVDQEVLIKLEAPPSVPAPPPPPMKVAPAVPVDPKRPDCTLGHKEPYVSMAFGESIRKNVKKAVIQFFVQADVEIQPTITALLKPGLSDGEFEVSADGIDTGRTRMRRRDADTMRTVCGQWIYNSNGLYQFEISAEDVTIHMRYYARPRSVSYIDAVPINIAVQLDQSIIGDNNNLDADTAIDVDRSGGIITVTLRNAIRGSGNGSSQQAAVNDGDN